jgi:hypothetical protein
LGLFSTEGGQFIGGYGMSQDNKLKTASGLSDLWDGNPVRRVRSGDGAIILPGRRLSMHLMAQPAVADILFRDDLLANQGLLSRLLVTGPESAAGTRLWHEEGPETDRDLKRYGARLLDILEMPLPLAPGKSTSFWPLSDSNQRRKRPGSRNSGNLALRCRYPFFTDNPPHASSRSRRTRYARSRHSPIGRQKRPARAIRKR